MRARARARSSYSRAGPRERSREQKKSAWLEVTSRREPRKAACIRVGGKTKGSDGIEKERQEERRRWDAIVEDTRTRRSVCVKPVFTVCAYRFSVYSDAFTLWSRLQRKKIVLKLEDRRKGIYLRASESTTREAHGLGKVCGKIGAPWPTRTFPPRPPPPSQHLFIRHANKDIFKLIREWNRKRKKKYCWCYGVMGTI